MFRDMNQVVGRVVKEKEDSTLNNAKFAAE